MILNESELISLIKGMIKENNDSDIDNEKIENLLSKFIVDINKKENELITLTDELSTLKERYNMINAFINPKMNIAVVVPEPRKDKSGVKPKPYYRVISSFPYKGKKRQIMGYVGTIDDLKGDNEKIKEKARQSVQKHILKYFPIIKILINNYL
jgi:hypothetical protein